MSDTACEALRAPRSIHNFELTLFTPKGEKYQLKIVQCSSCGVPAGVLDPRADIQIEALKTQIASIDERLTLIAKELVR